MKLKRQTNAKKKIFVNEAEYLANVIMQNNTDTHTHSFYVPQRNENTTKSSHLRFNQQQNNVISTQPVICSGHTRVLIRLHILSIVCHIINEIDR